MSKEAELRRLKCDCCATGYDDEIGLACDNCHDGSLYSPKDASYQGCQSSTCASCMDVKLLCKGITLNIYHSSINGLLRLLRKLNIEVAEVCDRLRWRNGESNIVLRFSSGCFERVFYKIQDGYAEIVRCSSNRRGFVSAHDPSSIKGLKAACQADFQKRRAK